HFLTAGFTIFTGNIREQSGPMLGSADFDPARDIEGITVNRWAHGYAYSPNPLFDPNWKEEDKPWVVGRQPFGRITISNSDAAAEAETDAAIDEAHRAVHEILQESLIRDGASAQDSKNPFPPPSASR